MSDHSISLVPKKSKFQNKEEKAQEILAWLISIKAVKSEKTDCILSKGLGHPIGDGSKAIVEFPQDLPFGLITNGLEITFEKNIFHAGENGLDEIICPSCQEDIYDDEQKWTEWYDIDDFEYKCSNCGVANDINMYHFEPNWGFSDLGFTFWNWPEFKDEFIKAFETKIGCRVNVVFCHI